MNLEQHNIRKRANQESQESQESTNTTEQYAIPFPLP